VKLVHHLKKESSGLFRTTLEICQAEMALGHDVLIKEPQGQLIHGTPNGPADVHVIHSQYDMSDYHTTRAGWGIEISTPVVMIQHGEPISSVGNGVSMRAIIGLSDLVDALICMRKEEQPIWNSIKRCYYVPKGVDLDIFKPPTTITERLPGDPAVLYYESWRGSRNPLVLCKAMELVWKKYPKAKLHLYNITDQRMLDTFKALREHNKWYFIQSLQGPVPYNQIPALIQRVDIVGSCLFPLYARTPIEALACGKACIAPGYPGDPLNDYPWTCTLNAESMADAIIRCHEHYGEFDYRTHAERFHDVREMVRQMLAIYEAYVNLGQQSTSLMRVS
jgi:glycosyltransferase involved in cell wall biosynthesis